MVMVMMMMMMMLMLMMMMIDDDDDDVHQNAVFGTNYLTKKLQPLQKSVKHVFTRLHHSHVGPCIQSSVMKLAILFFAHSANVIIESEAAFDIRKEQMNIKSILPYI